jgi:hypothetical protein
MPSALGLMREHILQQAIRTVYNNMQGCGALLPKEGEAVAKALCYHAIATVLNTQYQQPHCTWFTTAHGVQWQKEERLCVVEYEAYDIPFPLQGDMP